MKKYLLKVCLPHGTPQQQLHASAGLAAYTWRGITKEVRWYYD
jgi:hypothetical protein